MEPIRNILTVIGSITGSIGSAFAIFLALRAIRTGSQSFAIKTWRHEVEHKLSNIHDRLDSIEAIRNDQKSFEIMALRALLGILKSMSENGCPADMTALRKTIEDYLISKA